MRLEPVAALVAVSLLAVALLPALAQPVERGGAFMFAKGPWWRPPTTSLQARVGPTATVPLLYLNTLPSIRLYNATLYLNVHVRVIVGGEVSKPDFDVPYKANGTERVARQGEDVLEWLLQRVEMATGDPVTLEFPKQVEGYTLLNSTTITVDPSVQSDVWIYYAGAQAPSGGTQPPSQPGQQPSQPVGGGGPSAAQPPASPVEEWLGRLLWWLAWVVESIARWLALLWPWWLLLLALLAALLVYLWWRSRRRFALIVETKGR